MTETKTNQDVVELLTELSKAPDGQICKTITSELKYLNERGDIRAFEVQYLIDKCIYFALASDFAMRVLHILRDKLVKQENQSQLEAARAEVERYKELYSICNKQLNDEARDTFNLYNAIAPFLGLNPYKGTCNNKQVIWANSQEEADALPAGANIFTYVKKALVESAITQETAKQGGEDGY